MTEDILVGKIFQQILSGSQCFLCPSQQHLYPHSCQDDHLISVNKVSNDPVENARQTLALPKMRKENSLNEEHIIPTSTSNVLDLTSVST